MAFTRLADDISTQFNGTETVGIIANPPIVNVSNLEVIVSDVTLTQGVDYGVDPTVGEIDFSEGSTPFGPPAFDASVLIIYDTNAVANVLTPPTGIRVDVRTGSLDIFWFSIRDPEIAYNVSRSTESGGGSSGYERLTSVPFDQPDSVEEEIVRQEETVTEIGNTQADPDSPEFLRRTTTTEDTIKFNEIQKFSDTDLDPTTEYFHVLTSVNTLTNVESFFSDEVSGTPLAIPENPAIPRITKQDIIENMVENWLEVEPEADLKPGSILRDTSIEFPARELERLYTIERFRLIAQSFPTLLILDDENGDGESDPVETSSEKRALKDAFGFDSDDSTQVFIDSFFDSLAANNNTFRKGNQQSIGTATFFAESAFTEDVFLPSATTVGTLDDDPILYETLSSAVMFASIIETYRNPATNRFEIDVPIRAVLAGRDGDVSENTIRQVISNLNTPTTIKVVNNTSTRLGVDKESNTKLAERAQLVVTGSDPGTALGYRKTVSEINGIVSTSIIEAGDDIMLRDYDEVRRKHIGGKVDIYVRGDQLAEIEEQFETLYEETLNVLGSVSLGDEPLMIISSTEAGLGVDNFILKI